MADGEFLDLANYEFHQVRPFQPSEREARKVNGELRSVILKRRPRELSVAKMRVVCKEFPLALFLNTLGVAEYRLGNYQAAVEACLQSVELSPQQLGVAEFHARDLAFLAMSYHQLGKAREAETYRRQFLEAMKKDAFRDDEECLGFARELVKLFDGKGETESK